MKNHHVLLVFILLLCFQSQTYGQIIEKKRPKGQLYFSWGYNKDWFSKSNIHFKSIGNDDYDFTLNDVKAHDRPEFDRVFDWDISIPQFIYRLGYTFPKRPDIGFEISFDHAKYILTQNQVVHVYGKIHENFVDKDTILSRNFIRFEHTNGANFLMLSFIKKNRLLFNATGTRELFSLIKPGAGIVIPQSQVALFGRDQNNKYHIAGYVFGVDLELRYEYKKHFLIETGFKGVFANYLDVLSVGDAKANHSFFCLEYLVAIGYQFAL